MVGNAPIILSRISVFTRARPVHKKELAPLNLYSAAALFNSLPSNVKCCDNFKFFSKQTLCILRERCRNRV